MIHQVYQMGGGWRWKKMKPKCRMLDKTEWNGEMLQHENLLGLIIVYVKIGYHRDGVFCRQKGQLVYLAPRTIKTNRKERLPRTFLVPMQCPLSMPKRACTRACPARIMYIPPSTASKKLSRRRSHHRKRKNHRHHEPTYDLFALKNFFFSAGGT